MIVLENQKKKETKARAIDLYSGIGGWTLGLKMSDVENVASFEWWSEANHTHNLNFGTDHAEVDIRNLKLEDLPEPGTIDFVLGSPPCTQFSFANRGGNGNLADGLKDINKFLEVVEYLKPKYWAMENVPRVAKILERELGIGGQLSRFRPLVSVNMVVNASDYGVPQARKRMIAGHFPLNLFLSYKQMTPTRTLGDVLDALSKDIITDPVYGIELPAKEVTDNYYEAPLNHEEERINRAAKTFHPIYNNMSFPDLESRPSRTITATCTRVSRESIIVEDHRGSNSFRRLNIRERGVLQSFPITYQFHGKSYSSRFKMIGNAIPPLLAYYVVQSMLETPIETLKGPSQSNYKHKPPVPLSKPVSFNISRKKYPAKRSFKFAIPHLRFGSGVRFNLANSFRAGKVSWAVEFFYGNSKRIKQLDLNEEVLEAVVDFFEPSDRKWVNKSIENIEKLLSGFDPEATQQTWRQRDDHLHPFTLVDELGKQTEMLIKKVLTQPSDELALLVHNILKEEHNTKLAKYANYIIAGFLIGCSANQMIRAQQELKAPSI